MSNRCRPHPSSLTCCHLLLIVLIFTSCVNASVDSYRVRLVDSNPSLQRYLFRGNTPVSGGSTFDFTLLQSTLSQVAQQHYNTTLPAQYYLVDISFLFETQQDLKVEKQFFQQNPHLGGLAHWTILGALVNATDLPDWLRKELALNEAKWDVEDQLLSRVPQLHAWVWEKESIHSNHHHHDDNLFKYYVDGTPIVFYMHCEAGMDRTGEVSGAYYLKYFKWTFLQTLNYDYNIEEKPRPIGWANQNALNWFCWHLFYTEGYPLDCGKSLPRLKPMGV
ncbi:hypothetical protein C9374_007536 [Naegleria lovaniensis]|uniref:Tyrosine specific protein phosphatases domain-containing protein n=1 Tax=Naegleria lovaniensis TaxID=51637 RepID=A0AA88GL45_NAELO|nr:uncharacterized protein C9374_007536 [Naegleria lovaniensis]KAG2379397.1 hypothetical protein C9374_007536 [Naegleria lovaniensis]